MLSSAELTITSETSPNVDIEAVLGQMVTSTSADKTDELFGEVVDYVFAHDLQAEKIITLQHDSDQLLGELMDDPYASVVAEAELLGRLYKNRSLSDGGFSRFATRTEARDDVDLVFSVREDDDSEPWVVIETRLQNQLEVPVRIEARGEVLTVTTQTWHGGWRDVELPIYEDSRGESILKAVFADTLWATHLNYIRQPDEVASADIQARNLLRDHQIQARAV